MSWRRQACAYDDDALAQLASSGLLRRARKQLESGKVELLADEAGEGRFRVANQQVSLLDAPLERSVCDCSASGLCVHILAAVLQTRKESSPIEADLAAAKAAKELSALTPDQIMRWAGRPGTRLAARLLDGLDEGAGQISERPGSVEIVLAEETACRYILGASLEGVICDAPESRRKGIIAACLLHWMQRQSRDFQWPEESRPAQGETRLSKGESELLAQVRQQLESVLACGLMHLPQAYEQSLRNLAWSARGGELPRLSALLLRLCGEMAAFRDRQASSDSGSLLEQVVATWALCDGLSANAPDTMGRLRGAFRRDYTAAELGPLWSCGAYRYESRSGACGLGLLLWDLQSLKPLRINLGRSAETARSFNPWASWQHRTIPNPWIMASCFSPRSVLPFRTFGLPCCS
jgi:hypothetical protein